MVFLGHVCLKNSYFGQFSGKIWLLGIFRVHLEVFDEHMYRFDTRVTPSQGAQLYF